MSGKRFLYIGGGALFVVGLMLLCWGVLNVIAATSPSGRSGQSTVGLGFGIVSLLFLAGGAGLVYAAARAGKTEVVQQVTMKVDLPGDTKISQVTCRNCGGALQPENIKMVAGAPWVQCPYCGTSYQLTEEPKW